MNQLDHPFIVFPQAVAGIALLVFWFQIHRHPTPLPQVAGLLALSILTNLTARVIHAEWFFIADIAQYVLWALVILASSRYRSKQAILEKPTAADRVDRLRIKIVTGAIVFVLGLMIYYVINLYNNSQAAALREAKAAALADAKARKEFTEQKKQEMVADQEWKDSLMTSIDSVKENQRSGRQLQTKIYVRQTAVINSTKKLAKKAAETPAPAPQQQQKEEEKQKEHKRWYQKLVPWGSRKVADPDDDLVRYQNDKNQQ